MQKIFIKNRKGQNISVIVEETDNQTGLAFVMHGLGGFKEQLHIATFAQAFKEKGFTVIRFDTTNTLGESDGSYEDATVSNYYKDLEDILRWSKDQKWYQEPFALAGHSLGGLCTALFSERHPEKVLALAPISAVVSNSLLLETYTREELKEWKETGYRISESRSKPGVMKKLKWSFMEDRLRYDLLENADKLMMPVLLIVGESDTSTPPKHQQIFFDKLPGSKKLHIIKGASHTFREQGHLEEIKGLFLNWIDSFSK